MLPKKTPFFVLTYALCAFVALYFLESNKETAYLHIVATKILVFVFIPSTILWIRNKDRFAFLNIKKVNKKSWKTSLGIGLLMIAVVQGAYFLLRPFIDLEAIATSLESDVGITKSVYLYSSTYITFGNSFIEEFFFRGVLLFGFAQFWSWRVSSCLSAALFAGYHVSIFAGWFDLHVTLLSLFGLFVGGLFFNFLDKKSRTIYPGWVAHICGDIAVILVGMKMFGFF